MPPALPGVSPAQPFVAAVVAEVAVDTPVPASACRLAALAFLSIPPPYDPFLIMIGSLPPSMHQIKSFRHHPVCQHASVFSLSFLSFYLLHHV